MRSARIEIYDRASQRKEESRLLHSEASRLGLYTKMVPVLNGALVDFWRNFDASLNGIFESNWPSSKEQDSGPEIVEGVRMDEDERREKIREWFPSFLPVTEFYLDKRPALSSMGDREAWDVHETGEFGRCSASADVLSTVEGNREMLSRKRGRDGMFFSESDRGDSVGKEFLDAEELDPLERKEDSSLHAHVPDLLRLPHSSNQLTMLFFSSHHCEEVRRSYFPRILPPVEPLPYLHFFLPVRRNFRAPDDRVLRFIPYNGEGTTIQFTEDEEKLFDITWKDRTTLGSRGMNAKLTGELEFVLNRVVEQFGEEDCVFFTITRLFRKYLRKGLRVRGDGLWEWDEVKNIFMDCSHREKRTEHHFLPRNMKEATDSFRRLFCPRCLVYDCEMHADWCESVRPFGSLDLCTESMTMQEMAILKAVELFGADDVAGIKLFCFGVSDGEIKACLQKWDAASKDGFRTDVPEDFAPDVSSLSEIRRLLPGTDLSKIRSIDALRRVCPGYPRNRRHQPCCHPGKPCTLETCTCLQTNHTCDIGCQCDETCANRFRGCKCSVDQCRTRSCPCFAVGRECDPWVCKHKGAQGPCRCQNADISMGSLPSLSERIQLLVGRSRKHRYGLFLAAPAFVRKGQFLLEYTGEVISQAEAERRGKFCDVRACSYLFNLVDSMAIDAMRKGNKARFINHSDSPNCEARLVVVGHDHHIKVMAKRDIVAGEELFLDYNYQKDSRKKHDIK
eukprot:TRINITY_DN855_c0_g1_i1.p1 TRINITY_DN855_c0_g1~~TRINITY_DN855_c0_g1_i1.p1  ORF type:complete len:734 (-),score=155.47 TRINITY_DN855_c0_g1_i1:1764-3965(-)